MTFVKWIAAFILEWLLNYVKDEIEKAAQEVKSDKEKGVVNDANLKALQEAKDAEESLQKSLNLLNRIKP